MFHNKTSFFMKKSHPISKLNHLYFIPGLINSFNTISETKRINRYLTSSFNISLIIRGLPPFRKRKRGAITKYSPCVIIPVSH